MRRAKWSRPKAPMDVAVKHEDGMPLFRLTTHEEKIEEKDGEGEEDSYLEESFEEFEEEDEKEHTRGCLEELVIEEDEREMDTQIEQVDLSKTTKELFAIIQHLSRSKQRALVDVLQKFQSGEQNENDVKVLQSSIGDPEIWKEISATLNTPKPLPNERDSEFSEAVSAASVAPVNKMIEQQLQLENEYEKEIKERLFHEREEKHRVLNEAAERRAKMMKQLEDEEREIERLMEVKRQERLAKLRALQDETSAVEPTESVAKVDEHTDLTIQGETKKRRESPQGDGDLYADAKNTSTAPEQGEISAQGDSKSVSLVPRLNLSLTSNLETGATFDIHVKLLSTWGRTRAVGLTQICVYDLNGDDLSVDLETLQLHDQPTGRPLPKTNDMVRGLQRLFNGVAQTNKEKEMWLGRFGDAGVLVIRFQVPSSPSKLCVWNFNSRSHIACTRDVEVLVSGKTVWTGSLPETFGDEDDNICTWIDLLGSAKKTSRTSRNEKSSVSSERHLTTRVDETNAAKSVSGTPLWLSGSTPSSLLTQRLPATSRSSELDTWTADEKPSNGSTTSRRRQGKPLYSTQSTSRDAKEASTSDDRVEIKCSSPVIKAQKPLVTAPALASLSSWDSLEKFSKTNRSRLAQPTDTDQQESYDASPSASRTSFTTSALLTALRQGPSSLMSASPNNPDSIKPDNREGFKAVERQEPVADIPVLPKGKWLQLEILSTWGDPYYVGLNGIEIFNHLGELLKFKDPETQVTARPESINVLEENTDDSRVPRNLVDGVNLTCDDFHMWLAPFTPGQPHYVLLGLEATVSVSMIRIWNYNKSRTHTCRGVREVRIVFYDKIPGSKVVDKNTGNLIFEGEIRQAPGLVGADSLELSNEVILFTQDAAILEAIEANDDALRRLAKEQKREDEEAQEIVDNLHRSMELQRPRTSDTGSRTVESNDEDHVLRYGRPMTMASRPLASRDTTVKTSIDSWVAEEPQQMSPDAAKVSALGASNDGLVNDENLPRGRRLTLQLHSTWGDRNYIGLTQVEVLVGSHGAPLPMNINNLEAKPRDLASLGYIGDPRTLDKLVDGVATTCDDTHMWLVPYEAPSIPEVRIELKSVQYFYGLRVWNYNKSPEDTYRGVKQLVVTLDGVIISPKETGFLLRKAPGVADFEFGQLLVFSDGNSSSKSSSYFERVQYPFITRAYKTPIIRQDYEASLYPQGFLLKIICWTTWGDPYYLGLNGLELYDFSGTRIIEKPKILTAVPYSVSEIDNSRQQDTRIPDNLVSGLDKNTWEAHDAWLAPLASSIGNPQGNIVYIGFDTPVVLSMIKLWNYSKTPERGVKDVDIYLDDLHLFSGTLKKAPMADVHATGSRFGRVHKVTEQFGQPVLFSCSQAQVDAEKRSVYYCGVEEQDVLGINEGQVMQESRAMYRKLDPGAEGVIVDLDLRPMTAVCRQ